MADTDEDDDFNSTTSNEIMRSDVAEMGPSDLDDDSINKGQPMAAVGTDVVDQRRLYSGLGINNFENSEDASSSMDQSVENVSVLSAAVVSGAASNASLASGSSPSASTLNESTRREGEFVDATNDSSGTIGEVRRLPEAAAVDAAFAAHSFGGNVDLRSLLGSSSHSVVHSASESTLPYGEDSREDSMELSVESENNGGGDGDDGGDYDVDETFRGENVCPDGGSLDDSGSSVTTSSSFSLTTVE